MDWNRAKNILIAMFLIINIFLFYQLFTISRNQYKYIDQDELQSVIKHLEKKNVHVEGVIPDRVFIAPSLTVKYQEFDTNQLAKTFFEAGDYKITAFASGFEQKNDKVAIEVKNRIYLIYNNQEITIRQSDIDEDKCLNNAYSFIKKLKLDTNNKYVKLKEVEKGYVRLILGQQYNNIPVENSQIEIIATEDGVSHAKISWFSVIKPDQKSNITTPVVALLTPYQNRGENAEAVVIKQIRQGYYFSTEIKNNVDDLVVEGTAFPMWVIQTDKNEIYINAYNENIEKVR